MEPTITINGTALTEAQAMTLRVAANDFALTLKHEGLGDDDHGKAMTAGYLARLREIFTLMANAALTGGEAVRVEGTVMQQTEE